MYTLVLGLRCQSLVFDHCGPRTTMVSVHSGPRTTMVNVCTVVLGLRCHFFGCHSGPKAAIVVLGTILKVRTMMA